MSSKAGDFSIRDDFSSVSYEQWRASAEAALDGASVEEALVTPTHEGIDLQPVYSRRDQLGENQLGFPGLPPFVRGSRPLSSVVAGLDLCQEHDHPDLATANEAILEDVEGGATSLLLKLDATASAGLDPDDPAALDLSGRDGLTAYHVDDLDAALANVDLRTVGVSIEPGAAFLPAAAMLASLWCRREVPNDQARGGFNADPLAALARTGQLPVTVDAALAMLGDLAAWTAENYRLVSSVCVDTSPYHHAGATEAQDLAFSMATAVEYLRAMTAAGLDVDASADQILFGFRLGTHHFMSIAKLRAARRLWARVVEASGGSPTAAAMTIHARASDRVLTRRDPHVNLLRNTLAVYAAGIGGADVIASVPLDHAIGLPAQRSRRLARNTVLIVQHEAHLHRVIDPAGGSWFLDSLTEQLADKAWLIFQEIERRDGMRNALQSGWVTQEVDQAFARRAEDVAQRKVGITGVSEFPNIQEEPVDLPEPDVDALRAAATQRLAESRIQDAPDFAFDSDRSRTASAVDAAGRGASIGQLARGLGFQVKPSAAMSSFETRRLAEPFEQLRDASDEWLKVHGHRPRVFFANMGSAPDYSARANFAKNFFETGGFEVSDNDGFTDADDAAAAFSESRANIAAICSSDELYSDVVPQTAAKLKAAGARSVVLAGNPKANEQAWRAAGVDRFIFATCDAVAELREMLREEGVIAS